MFVAPSGTNVRLRGCSAELNGLLGNGPRACQCDVFLPIPVMAFGARAETSKGMSATFPNVRLELKGLRKDAMMPCSSKSPRGEYGFRVEPFWTTSEELMLFALCSESIELQKYLIYSCSASPHLSADPSPIFSWPHSQAI